MIEANRGFLGKKTKNTLWWLCRQQNVTRIKLGQGTYQLSICHAWALITLLTYPMSMYTAERSFSGLKRLQTPLRVPRQTRDCIIDLSCNSAYEHKDVIYIDGIITEFACLKGTHLALCL